MTTSRTKTGATHAPCDAGMKFAKQLLDENPAGEVDCSLFVIFGNYFLKHRSLIAPEILMRGQRHWTQMTSNRMENLVSGKILRGVEEGGYEHLQQLVKCCWAARFSFAFIFLCHDRPWERPSCDVKCLIGIIERPCSILLTNSGVDKKYQMGWSGAVGSLSIE